jgi:hypothetical protein
MALRILLAFSPLVFALFLPVLAFLVWMLTGQDAFKALPFVVTAAAYLSVALLGWALGHPRVPSMIVISTAFLAAFGFAVPILFNALVTRAANRVPRVETAGVDSITEPQVVAFLSPQTLADSRFGRTEMECGLLCQRLLYRGNRTAVLAGPAPLDRDPSKVAELTRYWIERRTTCPAVHITPADVLQGEHFVWGTDPTSDFTTREVARGLCLMSGPGSLSEADTVAMETRLTFDESSDADRGGGVQTVGESLFQRRAGKWSVIVGATSVRYSTVKVPLRFWSNGRKLRVESIGHAGSTPEPVIQRALGPWLGTA